VQSAVSRHSPGKNLSAIGNVFFQTLKVLIVHALQLIHAEKADLRTPFSSSFVSIVAVTALKGHVAPPPSNPVYLRLEGDILVIFPPAARDVSVSDFGKIKGELIRKTAIP
jgi:hypothetical protein